MPFYTTQCPRCFTDYVISDQQYHAAEGMVRCGTCREHFKGRILEGEPETPKFDPRKVFIEPLSSSNDETEAGVTEGALENTTESETPAASQTLDAQSFNEQSLNNKQINSETSFSGSHSSELQDSELDGIEFMSTHEFDASTSKPSDSKADNELSIGSDYANSDELSTSEILNNIRSRNQVRDKEEYQEPSSGQVELSLPDDQKRTGNHSRKEPELDHALHSENTLIDEVDKLVDEKLVSPSLLEDDTHTPLNTRPRPIETRSEPSLVSTEPDDDFFLEPKANKRTKKQRRGVLGLIALLFTSALWLLFFSALLAVLIYQLWLKQIITIPSNNAWLNNATSKVMPLIERGQTELSNYGIKLAIPQRRNLSQLELVSAKTEPHPTRSTTMLLKVQVINRAAIEQPLPWLEMSLMDADGRLVARRNLSPKDYIYNNKTNSNIGANELKKVTIELLSFPKSATGYEIKLLNN